MGQRGYHKIHKRREKFTEENKEKEEEGVFGQPFQIWRKKYCPKRWI
jgi:hypothetical protein